MYSGGTVFDSRPASIGGVLETIQVHAELVPPNKPNFQVLCYLLSAQETASVK
jgi:hypothetical protein